MNELPRTGVPELFAGGVKQRETLRGSARIAAPGCNASTVSLSLAPGVAAGDCWACAPAPIARPRAQLAIPIQNCFMIAATCLSNVR